jgi:hypothetical protein
MLTLIPAYGRDYKSKAAVLADLAANKDFTIATYGPDDGRYVNAEQIQGQRVTVRYSGLRKVAVVTVPKV